MDPARAADAIEAALKVGQGQLDVYPHRAGANSVSPATAGAGHDTGSATRVDDAGTPAFGAPWRFSTGLHCPDCDIGYKDPSPSTFSFNSPIGACETCRGFGRSIGVDYGLVIPNTSLSLRQGAVKPWQTESYKECQTDLLKFARKRAIPVDTPWSGLTDAERAWVIEGEGEWTKNVWYGVRRFFAWLETKAYKMHIRVLLSRYRSYTECSACGGARLKPEALLWRVGNPGITIREMMLLSIDDSRAFFDQLELPAPHAEAADLLLREIRARLKYLCDVGLGYLNLDRQSRTLSAARCSGSISRPRSAPPWSTPCSCWTSPPSDCIRAMSAASSASCSACATRATLWWWSSTIPRSCKRPIASSTSGRPRRTRR